MKKGMLLIFLTFLSCENSGADKIHGGADKAYLYEGLTSTYTCQNSAPPFSSLNQEGGSQTLCGNCHSLSNIKGGVDITSYSSLLNVVVPGSPNTSILYRVLLPGGLMSGYTADSLNKAVFCWIQGGAKP
ncbi:hypothetical protein CH373_17540 [Leptospira perolatii]|uniref:Cytochrome C Planctomycete-type domain-containing protein n=1 Tax=Leptospira perolatii TaxID=2023191 RepID=A0A2M9ZI97_9LEPT|nr:hypothetical protein [Leptospira perolatii]PJZ69079.1 hypothetical protein CH360_12385 [Leptospira perolatii]PJZ71788.1 hypothetical protein CH373_17540 [Leptospira perolatii]